MTSPPARPASIPRSTPRRSAGRERRPAPASRRSPGFRAARSRHPSSNGPTDRSRRPAARGPAPWSTAPCRRPRPAAGPGSCRRWCGWCGSPPFRRPSHAPPPSAAATILRLRHRQRRPARSKCENSFHGRCTSRGMPHEAKGAAYAAHPRSRIILRRQRGGAGQLATVRSSPRRSSARMTRIARSAGWCPKSPPAPMSTSCPA